MVFGFERSRPKFTSDEKETLYRKQSGICTGCKKQFAMQNMTVDHKIPFSHGGGERLSNLQLLCGYCNSLKGNGTMAQLRAALKAKGITKTATVKATTATKASNAKKPATKKAVAKKPATRKKATGLFDGW